MSVLLKDSYNNHFSDEKGEYIIISGDRKVYLNKTPKREYTKIDFKQYNDQKKSGSSVTLTKIKSIALIIITSLALISFLYHAIEW